ncbi:MAG: glycosyltransferase family 4 protein [Rhodospirillaceae bacterium]
MKIALVDPSLFTLPYDSDLAHALIGRGHEVALYGRAVVPAEAAVRPRFLVEHFYGELAAVAAARWPRGLAKVAKGAAHVRGMRRLVAALRRAEPDVIHFQWLPLPVVDDRFLPALRRIAPLVATAHDSRPFNANPTSAVQQIGASGILRRFDRVIVHTAQARDRLVGGGLEPGSVALVPHGVSAAPAAAPTGRGRRDRGDRRVSFLLLGRVKPYKGVDVLIEAVRRMPEADRRRCRVLVAGRPYMDMGPLEAARAAVADCVGFDLRFLSEAEMARLLEDADAFVFPYREIDTSGVFCDSLRLCRPIVASRIGAFAELLEDGRHALLVPPDDPDALAAALSRVVNEPGLRAGMADALAALADRLPSWDSVAGETLAIYRSARDAARVRVAA